MLAGKFPQPVNYTENLTAFNSLSVTTRCGMHRLQIFLFILMVMCSQHSSSPDEKQVSDSSPLFPQAPTSLLVVIAALCSPQSLHFLKRRFTYANPTGEKKLLTFESFSCVYIQTKGYINQFGEHISCSRPQHVY